MDIVTATQWGNSRSEMLAEGRAARQQVARKSLAQRASAQRDPVAILEEQNAEREQHLIPLRMERMLASPFAFFRGTAAIMAADLAQDPHSGLMVGSCGDAHLSNFGFFASPERRIVFDLNDFDEAGVAPWEWDVKRLVTSVFVGGTDTGNSQRTIRSIARRTVRTYARSLRALIDLSPVDRYFLHSNILRSRASLDATSRRALEAALKDAEKRTSARAVRRTTELSEDGRRRFVEQPPTMTHFDVDVDTMMRLYADYREGVDVDIDLVLSHYAPVDAVRRVVGVGSVGTRCSLVLLEGADGDTLLMQVKQATESVLSRYGGMQFTHRTSERVERYGEGFRVVAMQRVLQVVSDPFLGHFQNEGRDFYVRQFHDMKGSMELEGLDPGPFQSYADACATMLARAHGQSASFVRVVGYLGASDRVVDAIVDWSFAYAEQSLSDYRALVQAAQQGRVPVPSAEESVD